MVESLSRENTHQILRQQALKYLTRREYSAKELQQKLVLKGFDSELVKAQIEELGRQGLQSDSRFAENYMRFRREKGFGPIRIQQELQQRGVSQELIELHTAINDPQWLDYLKKVRDKRFGDGKAQDLQQRSQQIRYLLYRGFSQNQIERLIAADDGG